MEQAALLELDDICMHFPVKSGVFSQQRQYVKALDGVSLQLEKGKTLGLVGESGCGKSTLGKCAVRLLKPTAGRVLLNGQDITKMSARSLRPLRGQVQMMFQDPVSSLNPRMSVGQIVTEPLLVQGKGDASWRREQAKRLLDRVGLPAGAADRFPVEFSGGQRQRIGVARAIALEPELLILDEPVSALDVSVQSQVLNLLLELQEETGMAYLFIAHDLAVVKHISDDIAVMYLGKVVERARADDLYQSPKHAYTKTLIDSIPHPDPERKVQRPFLKGEIPSPINPPKGSAFGHRLEHPSYEQTVGLDMPLLPITPDHWVAHDPCCLSPEDYRSLQNMS